MIWYQKAFYIVSGILIGWVSAMALGLYAEQYLPK